MTQSETRAQIMTENATYWQVAKALDVEKEMPGEYMKVMKAFNSTLPWHKGFPYYGVSLKDVSDSDLKIAHEYIQKTS